MGATDPAQSVIFRLPRSLTVPTKKRRITVTKKRVENQDVSVVHCSKLEQFIFSDEIFRVDRLADWDEIAKLFMF